MGSAFWIVLSSVPSLPISRPTYIRPHFVLVLCCRSSQTFTRLHQLEYVVDSTATEPMVLDCSLHHSAFPYDLPMVLDVLTRTTKRASRVTSVLRCGLFVYVYAFGRKPVKVPGPRHFPRLLAKNAPHSFGNGHRRFGLAPTVVEQPFAKCLSNPLPNRNKID